MDQKFIIFDMLWNFLIMIIGSWRLLRLLTLGMHRQGFCIQFLKNTCLMSIHVCLLQPECLYYWTHTQQSGPPVAPHDVSRITPMWPPPQDPTLDNRPGLKYTEAGRGHCCSWCTGLTICDAYCVV